MISNCINAITSVIRSEKDQYDTDLSDSTNVYDLERRMRKIDQRSQKPSLGQSWA